MRDQLENPEIVNQLQVPDNEKEKTDVKQHQENPEDGLMSSNGRQKKGVIESPQPPGPLLRVDLKRCGILRFPKQFHKPNHNPQHKHSKSSINHGYQDDEVHGFHGNPLWGDHIMKVSPFIASTLTGPEKLHPEKSMEMSFLLCPLIAHSSGRFKMVYFRISTGFQGLHTTYTILITTQYGALF
jgi:hypothetical protein